MKFDVMNNLNTCNGLTNNEFLGILNDLADATGDSVYWAVKQYPTDKTSFTTTDISGFRAEVAIQGQDIEATITNNSDPNAGNKIVGRVDATHPPELRVRSILAGTAYTLLKLAEAHTI
jgi:hypothetical protein